MSRYRLLVLGALALATLVAVSARHRSRAAAPAVAETSETRPERAVAITIEGASIRPARTIAPKGSLVTVTVENRDRTPRRLALLGYERQVAPVVVAPGGSASLRFTADRPGEDFAWLVDGRPAGVFAVTGSHLVEGHR